MAFFVDLVPTKLGLNEDGMLDIIIGQLESQHGVSTIVVWLSLTTGIHCFDIQDLTNTNEDLATARVFILIQDALYNCNDDIEANIQTCSNLHA